MAKRLYRSRTDRMVAGVCGGLAEYFGIDPTIVRLVFVLLALIPGPGVLAYIVMAIVTPEQPSGEQSWQSQEADASVVEGEAEEVEPSDD